MPTPTPFCRASTARPGRCDPRLPARGRTEGRCALHGARGLARLGPPVRTDTGVGAHVSAGAADPHVRGIGRQPLLHPADEGWDGTPDGQPSELTRRRWRRFGESGAKLIRRRGVCRAARRTCEPQPAVPRTDLRAGSVRPAVATDRGARRARRAHRRPGGGPATDALGPLCTARCGQAAEPIVAYPHPLLDPRVSKDAAVRVMTDGEIDAVVGRMVEAAVIAARAGFQFVDIKHCHGYFGHELLSARTRPGRYGGGSWKTARASCARSSRASRPRPPASPSACGVGFDAVPYRKGDRTSAPLKRQRMATRMRSGRCAVPTRCRTWTSPAPSCNCCATSASTWSASRPAAPTTTRTSSVRRPSPRPTAIPPEVSAGRRVARQVAATAALTRRATRHGGRRARRTATSRTGCPTWRRPSCARAVPT